MALIVNIKFPKVQYVFIEYLLTGKVPDDSGVADVAPPNMCVCVCVCVCGTTHHALSLMMKPSPAPYEI